MIFLLAPIPIGEQSGSYNTITRWINCEGDSCYHEIGHKLDQEAGWLSQTKEFSGAQYTYLRVELALPQPSELSLTMLEYRVTTTPWYENFLNEKAEAYAIIFAEAGGQRENMPEIFQPFYDWELADEYIEKYVR